MFLMEKNIDLFLREISSIKRSLHKKNKFSIKVGLSLSIKICFVCFNETPLKMKNAFYFILKALFVLKTFKFLSWLFSHVEKMA